MFVNYKLKVFFCLGILIRKAAVISGVLCCQPKQADTWGSICYHLSVCHIFVPFQQVIDVEIRNIIQVLGYLLLTYGADGKLGF